MPSRQIAPAAVAMVVVMAPAGALGSPYETLDPAPAQALEVAVLAEAVRGRRARSTAIDASFATGVSDDLEASLTFSHSSTAGNGGSRLAGFRDPAMAVKWRFHDAAGWAAAVEPALSAPLGEKGMSEQAWRLAVPVGVSRRFDRWTLRGMVGFDHGVGRAPDFMLAGLLATYAVTETVALGAEVAADAPAQATSEAEVRLNAGFVWAVGAQLEIHGLAGQTVAGPGGSRGTLARIAVQAVF